MKPNRRSSKTREAINKAFFQLMSEKDFNDITVNHIAEKADLNRGTFYLHYVDKYDLLESCIEEQFNKLINSCTGNPLSNNEHYPTYTSILTTTEYFQENFMFFSCMLKNKGMPSFRERLHQLMFNGIFEQVNMNDINRGLNKHILVQFMASAIVGIIEWWIVNNMPVPAKQLAEELWNLLERNHIHS